MNAEEKSTVSRSSSSSRCWRQPRSSQHGNRDCDGTSGVDTQTLLTCRWSSRAVPWTSCASCCSRDHSASTEFASEPWSILYRRSLYAPTLAHSPVGQTWTIAAPQRRQDSLRKAHRHWCERYDNDVRVRLRPNIVNQRASACGCSRVDPLSFSLAPESRCRRSSSSATCAANRETYH